MPEQGGIGNDQSLRSAWSQSECYLSLIHISVTLKKDQKTYQADMVYHLRNAVVVNPTEEEDYEVTDPTEEEVSVVKKVEVNASRTALRCV